MLKLSEGIPTTYNLGSEQKIRLDDTTLYLDFSTDSIVSIHVSIGTAVIAGNTLAFKAYYDDGTEYEIVSIRKTHLSDGAKFAVILEDVILNIDDRLSLGVISDEAIGPQESITVAAKVFDQEAGIVDQMWDEFLTGATHNKPTSAGRMLRELSAVAIRQETAQGGADSTITFDVGASNEDCIYDRNRVTIVEGTGTGQSRIIIMYDGTTFIAVVDRPWAVIPDNTSVFQIVTGSSETDCLDHGYTVTATTESITLKAASSAVNDFYKDCEIWITAGTGAGQSRLITNYTGENQIALVSSNWLTTPDNTSIYHIKYAARKVACSLGATAKAQVNTEVDTAISDANLGPIIGSGAIKEVFTITDGTNPIDGVGIWITNDEAGIDVVAGTIYTNANGQATFHLNTGSYYSWKELAGYNFTNPQTLTVSA